MRENFNFEKIVKKKAEGTLLLLKILLVFIYVAVAVIGLFLTVAFANGEITLIVLVFGIDASVILLTWKFTLVEYEYSVMANTFYIAKIYNKSARQEIFEAELSRAIHIAPYTEDYEADANFSKPDNVIRAVSSMKTDNVWFAIFELENGKKALVFFDADEEILLSLRHHCPRAIVKRNVFQKGDN